MKVEISRFKMSWFLLRIWLLFQLYPKNGFAVKVTTDGKGESELSRGNETSLEERMARIEAKDLQQERKIEVLNALLEEEKIFSKQLSSRLSELEASATLNSPKNSKLLGRPKRPARLLSFVQKEKKNTTAKNNQFYGPATNCYELALLGYTLNGYYLVRSKVDIKNSTKIGVAYCQFQQQNQQKGNTETMIGNVDIKTRSVHFYVQRITPLSLEMKIVNFQLARLNEGNAMHLLSGIFYAPVPGVYHFQFSGTSDVSDSTNNYLIIKLQVNGANVGQAYSHFRDGSERHVVSLTASLRLKANDQVTMSKYKYGGVLFDDINNPTHFTGWLVEEDLM